MFLIFQAMIIMSAKPIKHDACSKIYVQIMNERFNVKVWPIINTFYDIISAHDLRDLFKLS
ncbi:hypothetical protein CAB17_12735 [Legionella sainthelensi]|uniref:Uncharacterized protein n=1 Tax=Legionella sainthelensi TaxID=28087 RepID=A0A2H5FMU5_9GAMM|nr:hypothetical protein CAB17_12440 [Legionella sainthelensi]AUH72810.1 hypothetical protein CAB17_12735 [Legionella sainthelensi]